MGSGTTAVAAKALKRNFIGFETNAEYHQKSLKRVKEASSNQIEELPIFQQSLLEING